MAINPITFTENVIDDFLRYQLTTYPFADPDLYRQLKALLRLDESRDTPLRKGPFISLSRPFKQGASVEQMVADGVFHPQMRKLIPFSHIRAHQEQAIRSIRDGMATLVSTGTGSGKTEAFLYPIISRCLELQDAGAPPGVAAVLVYPMNALAEDQLDRLRDLLAGSGISFGMYVGKTPEDEADVTGETMPGGTTHAAYKARLAQIRDSGSVFVLRPPEERASRQSMRNPGGQPRILLTNVKQLELLLTRGKDVGIFDAAPLEFMVFDEAHTFRGAQGAETACLIRRLRTFCGRKPEEVRHVATSATMAGADDGDEAARDFAHRFFGVGPDSVSLIREAYDELQWNPARRIPAGPSGDPIDVLSRVLAAVDAADDVAEAISGPLVELGGERLPTANWQKALAEQLSANELVFQLANVLATPQALGDIPVLLGDKVGRHVSEAEVLAWLALSAASGRDNNDPLLRPVVHTFVRGIGGGVVTFDRDDAGARLWLSGEDAEEEIGDDFRRFPVITCTTCGQHYFETSVNDFGLAYGSHGGPTGGDLVGTTAVWEQVPIESGGCRVLFVDHLVTAEDEEEDFDDLNEDGEVVVSERDVAGHPRLHPMFVCRRCGSLQEENSNECIACRARDAMVPVQVVRTKPDYHGQLHSCVACHAPGRRPGGGRYREPARPLRAVSVSDVHVLAQSMVHLSERRRLLVFADNRQDAAFQAGWMQDHARRYRLRTLIAQQIKREGVSIGDVLYGLDEIFGDDQELSRALLPEVWQVVPYSDSNTKHRHERLLFLRLQILRELAVGVKQRLGLEPWGRLKVRYVGFGPDDPVVKKWAPVIGVTDADLCEGIEAILDHARRTRLLSDDTEIFEKVWGQGDKHIQYGYIPILPGGPKGLKLTRGAADQQSRILQWVGTRPTQVWNAVAAWGVPEELVQEFLGELWNELVSKGILKPVSLKYWKGRLPGCAGAYQIDSKKLLLCSNKGRYRCDKCRRTTVRKGATGTCLAWHCGGRLVWEDEIADDFDLRLLDGNYAMLRAVEHSAQVQADSRERIENQFKQDGEQVNTLVCTPTLELGVDIGALDAVLMRNVPPTAANYWQRAGRAGRRHRMAVDVTYAQTTSFDQAYFREPLKLLGGQIEAPRFNLKNSVMLRKHVHATVLTTLHQIARRSDDEKKREILDVLNRCFPVMLKPYLFSDNGDVLAQPRSVLELSEQIFDHLDEIRAATRRSFAECWPEADAEVVDDDELQKLIVEMPEKLQEVIGRFKRRLDWALGEIRRLSAVKMQKGSLDKEDESHEHRCDRVVKRFKGTLKKTRDKAQGGSDDSQTMSSLAREGFLPGYGLESGNIIGTAEVPRSNSKLEDFDLARPPTVALREFVPGNAIYANGLRFVPRRYTLMADEPTRFVVDTERQVVREVGVDAGRASLAQTEIRAVPICDVMMPSQSQISDEEDFRFQMPVSVFGMELGNHGAGQAWTWGALDIRFRRAVQLRMVNVGAMREVEQVRLGYPVCLACGQSSSPFASKAARDKFVADHLERCGHEVQPTGFFTDVEVDVLGLHNIEDREVAFSLAEALRIGASRVLDMEVEDVQIMVIGHDADDACDVLLYDPMPGGSGLLAALAQRWEDVRSAALELLKNCPGACQTSCIDCLQTYRNRFYHKFLNRHVAVSVLESACGPLVKAYPIPEKLPKKQSTAGQPQTHIEHKFRAFLREAGLPEPECQKRIDLNPPHYHTQPDFFYPLPDEPGICIYTDGMSTRIHGNPEQARKDSEIRDELRSNGYEVVAVTSGQLDDRGAMSVTIGRIAKYLVGQEKAREIKNDLGWFDRVAADAEAVPESEDEGGA